MATISLVSKELLEKALQQFLNKDVIVLESTNGISVETGESYCSDLFRTTITYKIRQNEELQSIAVLIKRPPEAKQSLRFNQEMNYFQKEIEMFQQTLPEFHKILGDMGTISARCVYSQMEPLPLLIIEDLSPMGFKMLDRRKGLDLEHCLFVVQKLALFHAVSLVFLEKNPNAYDNYSEAMFWGKPVVVEWVQLSVEALIAACKRSPELQKIAAKLERIKDKIPERCSAASKPNVGGFHVLNHGDPWTNNFLFRYEDGKLKEIRLVDYQVVAYGSPSIDLHYFWGNNPTIEVRRNHLNTILQYYYKELTSNLEKLQFKAPNLPTEEEFQKDFYARAYYGFVSGAVVMPLIKCDSRQDANFENLLAPEKDFEGSFRHHVFSNPVAWEHLEYILPFFDRLGIFDY